MTHFVDDRVDLVHGAITGALRGVMPTISARALLEAERDCQAVAWLRQVGMYIMVARFDASMNVAGRLFRRDRTTVRHAVRLVDTHIAENHITARLVDLVEAVAREQLEGLAADEAATGFLPPVRRFPPIVRSAQHG